MYRESTICLYLLRLLEIIGLLATANQPCPVIVKFMASCYCKQIIACFVLLLSPGFQSWAYTYHGQASNRWDLGTRVYQKDQPRSQGPLRLQKGLGTYNWRAAGSDGNVTSCGKTSALSPSACGVCSSVIRRAFNIGNLEVRTFRFLN